ncbi:MAG: hypothetical protein PHG08_00155 [Bacilli bacterium]|nr:hypothetical protein [Bacilli bacterium]
MLEPISTLAALAATTTEISTSIAAISSGIATIGTSVVAIVLSISGIMSAIAALMPHPTEEGLYHIIYKLVNYMAFNVGNAANKVTGIQKEDK